MGYVDDTQQAKVHQIAREPCGGASIVHTLDRWARNVAVQAQSLQRLGAAGVGFASVTEQVDFTTPSGRLMLTVMGGIQEFFSAQTGIHVAKSFRERALSGLPAGPVPFGYRTDERGSVPAVVQSEADAVTQAFTRRASGESMGEIDTLLNTQGFRTRTGRLFAPYAVRDMLECRFYLGKVRYHDEEWPGKHDAIVSEALFVRVQLRRMEVQQRTRRTRGTATGILRGRIACGHCGSAVHAERNHHGYPIYRERHGVACETNGKAVVSHRIDSQMAEVFASLELPADWHHRIAKMTPEVPQVDIGTLMDQRRRLARAYADGAFNDAEYEARLSEINRRVSEAEVVWSPAIDDAAALLDDLPALWAEATLDERRRLIATLIDRVYVDIGTKRIGAITPAAPFRFLMENAIRRAASAACVLMNAVEIDAVNRRLIIDGFPPFSTINRNHTQQIILPDSLFS